ncbi:MAG: glycosyltransferase [Chlamydiales bacterium]
MRIDFLIGDNLYGSTLHFSKSLSRALNRLGVETRLFWVGDGHFFHAFYEILADPPDLTFSFSDIRGANQTPVGDLWQIPHLSYLIDPAIYFLHQLKGDYSYIACVDEEDYQFVRSLNFDRALFLPHGVDRDLFTPIETDRPYELVFFGSCIDFEKVALSWKEKYDPSTRNLLHEAARLVLADEKISILSALVKLGVGETNLPLWHHEVDLYTRGKDRVDLIHSLKDYPIHIWGEGPWKKYNPEAEIHTPIAFEQTIEIMKKAKVVLNSSPRFKGGVHERILYALMCGCMVVTGENPFVNTHFIDQQELLTYRYGQRQDKFADWLPNWHRLAIQGQEKARDRHTWDARAKTLLTCDIKSVR